MEGRIIADTSGIIALLDKDEQHHAAAVEIVRKNNIYLSGIGKHSRCRGGVSSYLAWESLLSGQ